MTASLQSLGWDHFFQQQLDEPLPENCEPARVMNVERSTWNVAGASGDFSVSPTDLGEDGAVAVGDWLIIDRSAPRAKRRLERKTLFKRRAPGTDRSEQVIAANVDTLFIVSSCNQDFNEARLERYLSIAHEAGVMPVVVLTKSDLAEDPADYAARASKLAPGLLVETVNALDHDSLEPLGPWLQAGQTIALLGSSGVGKSTLTNTLLGEARLATQSIRDDDDKGRHTTTSRQMFSLPGGAWLIDTPGMRELQLVDVSEGIDDVFAEIARLAEQCRFADCSHDAEPGCAVRSAIDDGTVDEARLARWRKLLREEAMNRESIAERRARGKATGRLYKSILSDSHARKGRS
jgi:ribosome biogenesis GTPase